MKTLQTLFTAHKAKQVDQGCVWGNGLPFAHHALRVDNFASQHGAAVHRELQDVNHLFAAVHFHVRASRHIVSTALRLLGSSVIEQTPEGTNGARSFDGAVVDINDARIGGGDLLPFSMRSMGCPKSQHSGNNEQTLFQRFYQSALAGLGFQGGVCDIHAPYYKVVNHS